MHECVTLRLEDDTVRFTPDGRIAVVDAIGALSEAECPDCIWKDLIDKHPTVMALCGDYTFPQEETVPVAGSDAWEIIQTALLDHLIDKAS